MLRVLAGAYAPCLFGCELCLLCLRALVCFAARPSPARVQRMHLAVANSPHSATAHAATAASPSGEFRRTLVGDEDDDEDLLIAGSGGGGGGGGGGVFIANAQLAAALNADRSSSHPASSIEPEPEPEPWQSSSTSSSQLPHQVCDT